MPDLEKVYLHRMIHIDNIPHILQNGITHSSSANSNPSFKPIGDGSLITTRSSFVLKNGKRLGDYIPFYFSVRTPMLYVIQKGFNLVNSTSAEKIVYCVVPVQRILDLKLDFVFTDGHAVDRFTTQYLKNDIMDIESLIDWKAVRTKYWKDDNDLDLKRRKEAEFLVLGDIATSAIRCYLVYNNAAKDRAVSLGVDPEKIYIKSNFYF